jgi:integrase
VSLKAARDARDRAKLQLLQGEDPGEAKQAAVRKAKIGETFEEIASSWHASRAEHLSPRYHAEVLRRLEADAFPQFGRKKITDITPPMVLDAMRRIEDRGARTMAHEVRGHVSEVFVWAISSGLAENDPAAIIRKALQPSPNGRFPAVLTISEARKLIKQIDVRTGNRALVQTKLASRLLALTAVRPGVLRQALREEFVDLDGDQPHWRIPAARMKLVKTQKADPAFDFVVPLSRQSLATVAAAMSSASGSQLLFPGARRKQPISDSTLSQLYLDAGYRGRHVPHGWRSTFSIIMNERASENERAGNREVIDLMLAHVKGDVEARYNRAAYMPRRRELAQEWADLLMEGLPPPETLLRGG